MFHIRAFCEKRPDGAQPVGMLAEKWLSTASYRRKFSFHKFLKYRIISDLSFFHKTKKAKVKKLLLLTN